jgi:hypothetical protein
MSIIDDKIEYDDYREDNDYTNDKEVPEPSMSLSELNQMDADIESGELDPLDMVVISLLGTDDDGSTTVTGFHGTSVKDGKLYIEDSNGNAIRRVGKEIKLKTGEYLSTFIDFLPAGLIDKKATGIGATSLELGKERCRREDCKIKKCQIKSYNRNSIIVTPTRALALNKRDNPRHKKVLYVGGDKEGKFTKKNDIIDYLENDSIKYKKFLVVADSLPHLIRILDKRCGEGKYGKNVYRDYFLLVDEIDSLQQDSHFRPKLPIVIDYYLKFKRQRRALMSATIQEFSHPELDKEPLTTFKTIDPEERDITLYYTQDINLTLTNLINRLYSSSVEKDEKILIAFNSVKSILQVIKLLPEDIREKCSILCGEGSKTSADNYYREELSENDTLPSLINFMTCVYFAGIDIKEECHLITVSDAKNTHKALSLNRIIQIYGRCRKGVLSDNIVYNTTNNPTYIAENYKENYKEQMKEKAKKVLRLLDAADKLNDENVKGIFDRIMHLIMKNSYERFNYDTSYTLVRETIDGEREIDYFNIDSLYENAETFGSLYSFKDGLYNQLLDIKHNVSYDNSLTIDEIPNQEELEEEASKEMKERIAERIAKIKEKLLDTALENNLCGENIDDIAKEFKGRREAEFFKRIKLHYQYIDIEFLLDRLEEIALKNKKSYRTLKNKLSFFILDDKHPFKLEVVNKFTIGQSYYSDDIKNILSPIVEYHFFIKNLSRARLVSIFKSAFSSTYSKGNYTIKGYNPLNVPTPRKKVSADEKKLNKYFDI